MAVLQPPADAGPAEARGRPFVLLVALLALLLPALLVALPAHAASRVQLFHIEEGDAALTLTEFSRQAGLQLLFDYSLVKGRRTRAVSGEYPPEAALGRMLLDTGLVFDFVNDRTLSVTPSRQPAGKGSAIAEAPTGGRTRSADTQTVAGRAAGSVDPANDPKAQIPAEIIITGTHVRGEEPVGVHVVSLSREDIERSGAATVPDLLRTLPQAFGGGPSEDTHFFSEETGTNSGLGAGINLRGLGARATLVLINGKRLAPSGSEAEFADVENIPLAAIERIDILPDSASALYGADAVGGVVNFVMRDDFTGAESTIRGGTGTQNTLRESGLAQTSGLRWDSGNAMLSVEFYERGDLPAAARRYANSDLVPLGGSNFNWALSNPGNIVVGNQIYAIPKGQDGTALTASDLVAGTQNLQNKYTAADLLPSQRRLSLYGSGRQELTDAIELFGNAMVTQRKSRSQATGFSTAFSVPDSNPFYVNPTGGTGPVAVDYNFLDDIGPAYTAVQVNNFNFTLGTDIDLGAAWKLSLYANYAQEREDQFNGGQIDSAALATALADSNPATAFNPFGDGSHTNPATLAAIATGSRFYTDSRLRTGDITADGPVGHLPGGPIELAVGADHRNQVFDTIVPASVVAPASRPSLSRNVNSAFGELTFPLFGKENALEGLQRLELSVAGRYERYSDFGQATTPKFSLGWSPLGPVGFRGTWGRSIRAPTLSDLDVSQNIVVPYVLADKSSALGYSNVLVESGKNANLTVEHARSWTAGVDIDTRDWGLPGFTVSATYFNIDFRNRIQTPTTSSDILGDPALGNLITRMPTAAQVDAACGTGRYVLGGSATCQQYSADAILDLRIQNMARVLTRGIDLSLKYERTWAPGTLRLDLDGTYLLQFAQQQTADAQLQSVLNTQNNPINLKMRGTASWQQRRWGATVGINFQNSYQNVLLTPSQPISSYTTFDTQLRYELPAFDTHLLQHTRVEFNAVNLFNKTPPFVNNQVASLGYDQENADPNGRVISLQVRKSW